MSDPDKQDAAIRLAAYAYRRRVYPDDGPDTLLELADLLDRVWELLWPTANVNRLNEAVAEDSDLAPLPFVSDFTILVDRYARLARAAHRGRGKPPKNMDLASAYRVLADFWQEQEGTRNFSNGWMKTKDGLAPTSPTACFLYDALKEIDPDRPRLAEELRDLMTDTVKHLPGRRRGRRG